MCVCVCVCETDRPKETLSHPWPPKPLFDSLSFTARNCLSLRLPKTYACRATFALLHRLMLALSTGGVTSLGNLSNFTPRKAEWRYGRKYVFAASGCILKQIKKKEKRSRERESVAISFSVLFLISEFPLF